MSWFRLYSLTLVAVVLTNFYAVEAVETFKNPIYTYDPLNGCADPYVYLHTDQFYYSARCGPSNTIVLFKSDDLTQFESVMNRTIFTGPAEYIHLQEPEIHFIEGRWYIYFSMSWYEDDHDRRSFVISAAEAFGPYNDPIRLETVNMPRLSIHGTTLQHKNGQLYFLWAGRHNDSAGVTINGIYISQMESPTQLSGKAILLRSPQSTWEVNGTLESPQILQKYGRTCMAYCDIVNLKAGLLCIEDWQHPLVAENWVQLKEDQPSFWGNEVEGVYLSQGGKVSFTTSPDRTESWILYKALEEPVKGKISIRAERFGWIHGYPIFPRPTALTRDITVPSRNRTTYHSF